MLRLMLIHVSKRGSCCQFKKKRSVMLWSKLMYKWCKHWSRACETMKNIDLCTLALFKAHLWYTKSWTRTRSIFTLASMTWFNPCPAKYILQKWKIYLHGLFLTLKWHRYLESLLMENKDPFITKVNTMAIGESFSSHDVTYLLWIVPL